MTPAVVFPIISSTRRLPGTIACAATLLFSTLLLPTTSTAQGLSVVSASPARQAISAPTNTSITITFDRALDPATVTAAHVWAFARWSGTVSGPLTLSTNGEAITLTPSHPFSAGESVMVIVSEGLSALDGTDLTPGGFTTLFWTATALATLDFTRIDEFTTRSTPTSSVRSYGGVGCDLNEDGHLDVAVINEDSADLRVFLNLADGSGLFGPLVSPPSAINLQASPNEPSDFDRDGHIDLVVCNIATDTISVLLGNGDGSFQPQQQIAVGNGPRGVAVLDVDGDGDIDIVNTNFSDSNLSLLLNNGSGVFGPPTFFDGGGIGERSLAAADFNEDGRLDLACGSISGQTMTILLSNGDGTFTLSDTEGGVGGTWMLALGDLNGDGHVDITSANSSQNAGSVNFGNGDGTISAVVSIPTDPFPIATDLGDIDGDGDLDWITSSFSGDWFLFLNNGAGSFSFQAEFLAPVASSCAVMMDIDTDGDLDLALIDEIVDVVILEQNGGSPPPTFVRGDSNLDGVFDIADPIGQLAILFGGAPGPTCLDALDGNDDGVTDISDPIAALTSLFTAAGPLPSPSLACGDDPTPDGLDCSANPSCP